MLKLLPNRTLPYKVGSNGHMGTGQHQTRLKLQTICVVIFILKVRLLPDKALTNSLCLFCIYHLRIYGQLCRWSRHKPFSEPLAANFLDELCFLLALDCLLLKSQSIISFQIYYILKLWIRQIAPCPQKYCDLEFLMPEAV